MQRNTIPKNNSRAGQLLIEMLVALGILTIGFLGVTALLSRALGLNRVVADNYIATYLAAEGIEITKNILDGQSAIQKSGWCVNGASGFHEVDFRDVAFKPYVSRNFITYEEGSNLNQYKYGYGFAKVTPYTRTIDISCPSGNEIIVHSVVDWTFRGGGVFQTDLEDHFFNWRP
jgi:Tfp pilus assembly protein PilV